MPAVLRAQILSERGIPRPRPLPRGWPATLCVKHRDRATAVTGVLGAILDMQKPNKSQACYR
jgi:hypothetical protein